MVKGAVDVDIGANPSAEGGEEDDGVDDTAVKVVDIVDTFRLQASILLSASQFHFFKSQIICENLIQFHSSYCRNNQRSTKNNS